MNFPMEFPLFRFLYWLINTPGVGGMTVLLIVGGSLAIYFSTLRWIARGGQTDEAEVYTYPTSSLLDQSESKHTQPD